MQATRKLTLYPGFLRKIKRYVFMSALFRVITVNSKSLRDSEKVKQ